MFWSLLRFPIGSISHADVEKKKGKKVCDQAAAAFSYTLR